jgi:hypothetical protein
MFSVKILYLALLPALHSTGSQNEPNNISKMIFFRNSISLPGRSTFLRNPRFQKILNLRDKSRLPPLEESKRSLIFPDGRLMLLQCPAEDMASVVPGDEVEIVIGGRIEGRPERFSSWVADGAGGETGIKIGVVGIVQLEVFGVKPAVE